MKFFSTSQIRELDKFTIENEPIASIDLMERAALAIANKYIELFSSDFPVCVIAGPGNNGGDALAVARLLLQRGYHVTCILLAAGSLSADCKVNHRRLEIQFPRSVSELTRQFIDPEISKDTVIIDGIFGSGLSRTAEGMYAYAINWINSTGRKVVSIDIPSGLQGEENKPSTPKGGNNAIIVKADYTFSLQFPKLAFLFPENAEYVGSWKVLDIGIHSLAIENTESEYFYLEKSDIQALLKCRSKFSHKGSYGHALIIAGSMGMAGASILSAKASLRSGAGLVTVKGPECNRAIVQTAFPEAIYLSDHISDDNLSKEKFDAIAIGPGIGTLVETASMLENLLKKISKPCVLDADALNIIAQHDHLLKVIPKNSILTPHPKEFERMFGICNSSYERMLKAQKRAKEMQVVIILKGAHTLIANVDGKLYFNSTGNSGMATAGSGDVLTGILVGLLAQGYSPLSSSITGVYLHGIAGNKALGKQSEESLIAGDIVENLGKAFQSLHQ